MIVLIVLLLTLIDHVCVQRKTGGGRNARGRGGAVHMCALKIEECSAEVSIEEPITDATFLKYKRNGERILFKTYGQTLDRDVLRHFGKA